MPHKIGPATVALASLVLAFGVARESRAALVNQGNYPLLTQTPTLIVSENPLADGGEGPENVPFFTIVGPNPGNAARAWLQPRDVIFFDPNDPTEAVCPTSVAAGNLTGCSDVVRMVNDPTAGAQIYFASDDDGSAFASLPGGAVPQPIVDFAFEVAGHPFQREYPTASGELVVVNFRSDTNEGSLATASDTANLRTIPALPAGHMAGLAALLLGVGGVVASRRRGPRNLAH